MLLQKSRERPLQLTGAVAVDEADDALVAQQRLVEKPLGPREASSTVQPMTLRSGGDRLARLQLDVDARRCDAGRARPPITRRSRTLARMRLPRTSTSAVPS